MGLDGHVKKEKAMTSGGNIQKYLNVTPSVEQMTAYEAKDRMAEVKVTNKQLTKHIIPLAFTKYLSQFLKEIFPDSEIATKYGAGMTKATCILNRALKPSLLNELVQQMRDIPYHVSTDSSNDSQREKMNPVTVKLFDVDKVKHKLLDMYTTSGSGAETAEVIFSKMVQCPQM